MLRAAFAFACLFLTAPWARADVTSAEGRKVTLLQYVEGRTDLDAAERKSWSEAVRTVFGGKAILDGTDEGVTVAKSVLSGAIFFGIKPKDAAKAAYEAFHDTYRWVPPPLAINYQLLAFQGKKPKVSARELSIRFPRYFNEDLAPELATWWAEMLEAGKINPLEAGQVRETLAETRGLMRPMLLERLWAGSELEARARAFAREPSRFTKEQRLVDEQLARLSKELARDFRGVGKRADLVDGSKPYYDRYRALSDELAKPPRPAPTFAVPAPTPREQRPPPPPPPTPPAPPKKEKPNRDGFAEARPAVEDKPAREAAPMAGDALVRLADGWGERLESTVATWIGTPYLWGGNNRRGVDCSGFTKHSFREALDVELPRTASMQFVLGVPVEQKELRRGDLVFFDTLDRGRVTHVGVFLGAPGFAHASSTFGVTKADLQKRYYQRAWWGARRVIAP